MSHGLLVVDVQPAYNSYCAHIARDVAKRINNTRKSTVIMWVGDGLTSDTEEDVRCYLHEHGARPGKLRECAFVEKDYWFFRPWMDSSGYNREHIITVGKELMRQRLTCSEQLDVLSVLGDDVASDLAQSGGAIHLPSFDTGALRYFDKLDTCGGGLNECLAEIELLLDMCNIPYTQLTNLTY